jgi:peptide/nickel transport system permease protein
MGKINGDRLSGIKDFWRQYKRNKPAVAGLIIFIIFLFIAIFAPYISPLNPRKTSRDQLEPPSSKHMMGTDLFGRDILSRVIWGARISMIFGFVVAGTSLLIGIFLGALAGYAGGRIDDLFSRFTEIFIMIPSFFLIIVVVAIFGSNIIYAMVIVALKMWPSNARIMRSQVLTLKKRPYVEAIIGLGASTPRIIFRHIVPNSIYPVIANSILEIGRAILTEASISFLGLGDPNHPSWGQILSLAQDTPYAWWLALFPGIALTLIVLSSNLIGDGISYVLNPRMRER